MTKLLFLVTEDWYFLSHRLPMARAAKKAGYDVHLATQVSNCRAKIEAEGVKVHQITLARSGLNVFKDLSSLWQLIQIYRTVRPDITHHVAIKPVIYGSIAARLTGVSGSVNALAGLGYVFANGSFKARILRILVTFALAITMRMKKSVTLLQNEDDANRVVNGRMARPSQIKIIRGSGVDTKYYKFQHRAPTPNPTVALPARLLKEKGVYDFVEAIRILHKDPNISAKFVLLGSPDEQNPSSIPVSLLNKWTEEGLIDKYGWVDDMASALANVDIVCLPSTHGEGLPKSLLEAASCGIPIVTTDTPGCRDVVEDDKTGFLVPPCDPPALASALNELINDPEQRAKKGHEGRKRVLHLFDERIIQLQITEVYAELLVRSKSPS